MRFIVWHLYLTHLISIPLSVLKAEDSLSNKNSSDAEILKKGLALLQDYCDKSNELWAVNAQASLGSQNVSLEGISNKDYKDIQDLGCDLINQKQKLTDFDPKNDKKAMDQIKETLNKLISSQNPETIQLLFNNIYETWNLAKNMDNSFFTEINKILKNPNFTKALKNRITDKKVPS
ncbi:MAG: hypothetical protein GDA46_06990, partial [Bdellovibrionales bacterium]|nr:hypothetical protein [Bdellovibrionales bacterium]